MSLRYHFSIIALVSVSSPKGGIQLDYTYCKGANRLQENWQVQQDTVEL